MQHIIFYASQPRGANAGHRGVACASVGRRKANPDRSQLDLGLPDALGSLCPVRAAALVVAMGDLCTLSGEPQNQGQLQGRGAGAVQGRNRSRASSS